MTGLNLHTSAYPENQIIFFDGVCGLCNKFVDFLIKRKRGRAFLFAPLQGETALRLFTSNERNHLDTFVLLKDGVFYFRSSAAIRVFMLLGGGWKLAGAFLVVPPFIRDAVYNLIAKNRYKRWGKWPACRVPDATEKNCFLP